MICQECGKEIDDHAGICPGCGKVFSGSGNFFDKIVKVEEFFLSTVLGLMVFMVLFQILLRNFFSSGIAGGDSIVRHLLLWVAFLGAGIATKGGMHIKIDLASKLLSQKGVQIAGTITNIFSVIVGCLLVYAAYDFVKLEYESQGELLFFHLPLWVLEIIIPIGYLIITLRFASKGIEGFLKLIKEK
ncbi:MAG: TRAP transporter small permease subunit [Desulfobacterales bacterium]